MPLAKAQAITQTENHASTIFVLLKDRDQTDAVAAALQSQPVPGRDLGADERAAGADRAAVPTLIWSCST